MITTKSLPKYRNASSNEEDASRKMNLILSLLTGLVIVLKIAGIPNKFFMQLMQLEPTEVCLIAVSCLLSLAYVVAALYKLQKRSSKAGKILILANFEKPVVCAENTNEQLVRAA